MRACSTAVDALSCESAPGQDTASSTHRGPALQPGNPSPSFWHCEIAVTQVREARACPQSAAPPAAAGKVMGCPCRGMRGGKVTSCSPLHPISPISVPSLVAVVSLWVLRVPTQGWHSGKALPSMDSSPPRFSALIIFPPREKRSGVTSEVMQTGGICVSSAAVCRSQRFVTLC